MKELVMARLLFLLVFLSAVVQAESSRPVIVSSIKPLMLLAQDIGGDRFDYQVLLEGDQSPHHLQLRPSQLRLLDEAVLLLWIGRDFEHFLEKPIKKVNSHLPLSSDYKRHNLHIWLDPGYVPSMAKMIEVRLAQLQPESAALFAEKLQRFEVLWSQRSKQWKADAAQVKGASFVANHDNWEHFFEFYQLSSLFSLQQHHGHAPGAKRRAELKAWLSEQEDVCLLVEPGQPLTVGFKSVKGEYQLLNVDSMAGAVATAGSQRFVAFYQGLLDSVASCK